MTTLSGSTTLYRQQALVAIVLKCAIPFLTTKYTSIESRQVQVKNLNKKKQSKVVL